MKFDRTLVLFLFIMMVTTILTRSVLYEDTSLNLVVFIINIIASVVIGICLFVDARKNYLRQKTKQ